MIVVTLDDLDALNILKRLEPNARWNGLAGSAFKILKDQIEEQLISQAKAQTKGEDRDT